MKYFKIFEEFKNSTSFEDIIGTESDYLDKMFYFDSNKDNSDNSDNSDYYGNGSWLMYLEDLEMNGYSNTILKSDDINTLKFCKDIQDKLYQERSLNSIRYRFEMVINELNHLFKNGKLTVYRSIDVNEDFFNLSKTTLGIYWSNSMENLRSYNSREIFTHTSVIVAVVTSDIIDYKSTILCRMNYRTGTEEQEIRMLPNSEIKVIKIYKGNRYNSIYVRDLGELINPNLYVNKKFNT